MVLSHSELKLPFISGFHCYNHDHDQINFMREGFISYTFPHNFPSLKKIKEGTQGRNCEIGSDT